MGWVGTGGDLGAPSSVVLNFSDALRTMTFGRRALAFPFGGAAVHVAQDMYETGALENSTQPLTGKEQRARSSRGRLCGLFGQ
ncbi:hypothetical protein TcBrA4_0015780 [Trypanosoma cruzi]|nr:hypothetical protein TcBrA4_0015780 [Trypanosoma cruzi]